MKKLLVTLASSLLFVATATLADPPQHHDRQNHQGQRSQQGQSNQRGPHAQRPNQRQVKYIRDSRGIHDSRGRYYVNHDNGQHLGWYKRGGQLPVRYRTDRYYVSNWGAYHLSPPPSGYRWVRSDNSEFLLVAIATGIISNIVLFH